MEKTIITKKHIKKTVTIRKRNKKSTREERMVTFVLIKLCGFRTISKVIKVH